MFKKSAIIAVIVALASAISSAITAGSIGYYLVENPSHLPEHGIAWIMAFEGFIAAFPITFVIAFVIAFCILKFKSTKKDKE